jgi:hypothetical protein
VRPTLIELPSYPTRLSLNKWPYNRLFGKWHAVAFRARSEGGQVYETPTIWPSEAKKPVDRELAIIRLSKVPKTKVCHFSGLKPGKMRACARNAW